MTRCKHPKLCFTDGGLVLACPNCGREWIAYKRNGWKIDYEALHDGTGGSLRLDPQNEVRGE